MSFRGLVLTNAGRNELIKAEMGTPFRITDIVFGDGSYNGSYTAIKSLVHKVMEMPVTKIERKGDEVWVECDFVSTDVPEAFYMREIGIIANGQLCYYDNAREDAEYIDPDAGNLIKQKRMRFVLLISGEVEIHTEIASSLYALETDLRAHESTQASADVLGHVQLSDATDVTDSTGLALPATEKNAALPGTLAHEFTVVRAERQTALDALYQQLTQYTDKEIADLINGAPGTLDTLGEIAEAMQDNADVVEALEQAIATKASKAETESALTVKLDKTGDAKDNTVTFTSADVADGGAGSWTSVAKLTAGEKLSSVLNKVSTMFKNVRYLYKMLGTTDISAIGGGTVTGAISKLNTDLVMNITNETYSSTHYTHQTPVLIYFTVPYDGYYLVTALVTYEKNANGYREIFLKNTVTDNITGRNMTPAITDSYTTLQVVSGTPFAPGQYGTLELYQNSGVNLSVTGWINMVKIAPQ